jgi:pimeloyl-ACP methyl ester carboxylesterase
VTLLDAEHGFLEVEPHDPAERRSDREVVVLLHGLGGNKADWSFPAWRSYHWDFDGVPADRESDNHLYPPVNPWDLLPEFSLSDLRDGVRCWTGVLTSLGHTVVSYSQDGPQQRVDVPLEQFEDRIVPFLRDEVLTGALAGKRVVLLCHSRGGILARAYLRRNPDASEWISRVITLCSPHQGTLAPNAKQRLVDAATALGLFPFRPLVSAITRITGWLDESAGAQQLLPDDPIFADLALPAELPDIDFATFGGTSVRYTRVYSWHFTPDSYVPNLGDFPDIRFDWTLLPVEIPVVSPAMECLPDPVVDDEQDEGEGDGLVADDRARLPDAPHRSLPINHAEALWDEGLFAEVAALLGTPLNGDETVECVRGFVGNQRSREVHDPSRKRRNCQLDEIVEPWPFKRAEEAFDAGYDGCAYCMPEHHTR